MNNIPEEKIDLSYKIVMDSLVSDDFAAEEQVEKTIQIPFWINKMIEGVAEKLGVTVNQVIVSSISCYANFRHYNCYRRLQEKQNETIKKEE